MSITPDQIPQEVVEAYLRACAENEAVTVSEAIAAALAAWPGMMTERRARCDAVVLPFNLDADLPLETSE